MSSLSGGGGEGGGLPCKMNGSARCTFSGFKKRSKFLLECSA